MATTENYAEGMAHAYQDAKDVCLRVKAEAVSDGQ